MRCRFCLTKVCADVNSNGRPCRTTSKYIFCVSTAVAHDMERTRNSQTRFFAARDAIINELNIQQMEREEEGKKLPQQIDADIANREDACTLHNTQFRNKIVRCRDMAHADNSVNPISWSTTKRQQSALSTQSISWRRKREGEKERKLNSLLWRYALRIRPVSDLTAPRNDRAQSNYLDDCFRATVYSAVIIVVEDEMRMRSGKFQSANSHRCGGSCMAACDIALCIFWNQIQTVVLRSRMLGTASKIMSH